MLIRNCGISLYMFQMKMLAISIFWRGTKKALPLNSTWTNLRLWVLFVINVHTVSKYLLFLSWAARFDIQNWNVWDICQIFTVYSFLAPIELQSVLVICWAHIQVLFIFRASSLFLRRKDFQQIVLNQLNATNVPLVHWKNVAECRNTIAERGGKKPPLPHKEKTRAKK